MPNAPLPADDPTAWHELSGELYRGMIPLRRHRTTWPLVLAARGIPCRSVQGDEGWQLLVHRQHLAEAYRQISLYETENRNWPPPPPVVPPLRENPVGTLVVLAALAAFANLTEANLFRLGFPTVVWQQLGQADAALIRQGEWWRCVTALTLHSGWLHLLGNLVFGGVFGWRLSRETGSGLAWLLILLAGFGGNLLNALLRSGDYVSVGASTAVFGAIGLLATLNLVRFRKPLWKRWALPLAAALGLLGMLGSGGERTDLGGHLFGFACGLIIGALAALGLLRWGRPGSRLNATLGTLAWAAILGAWWLAIRRGG